MEEEEAEEEEEKEGERAKVVGNGSPFLYVKNLLGIIIQ